MQALRLIQQSKLAHFHKVESVKKKKKAKGKKSNAGKQETFSYLFFHVSHSLMLTGVMYSSANEHALTVRNVSSLQKRNLHFSPTWKAGASISNYT